MRPASAGPNCEADGGQEVKTADKQEKYLQDSVQQLCMIEVADRRLDEQAGDRVRDAFFDKSKPEAERLAAKQAVAAALRRRASSGTWTMMAKDQEGEVGGLVRSFAVVHALDPNPPTEPEQADNLKRAEKRKLAKARKQVDITSAAAVRDRSKALHELRRQVKKKKARESVETAYREQTGAKGLPSVARTRRVFLSLTSVVTTPAEKLGARAITRIAAVIGRGPSTEASSQVVDPDLWGTLHNSADNDNENPTDADKALFAALLTVYSTQYGSYTTLLWQVPALSMTAQAFLLTIALTNGNDRTAQVIASVLSIIIALASVRLMHDQRGHAINHGELALRASRKLGLADQFGNLNVDDAKPARVNAETLWVGWDRGIYAVWKTALYLFLAADLVVLGLVISQSL